MNNIQRSNLQTALWNLETHDAEAVPGFFTWDEVLETLQLDITRDGNHSYHYLKAHFGTSLHFLYLCFGTLIHRHANSSAITYSDVHCALTSALAGIDTDFPIGVS